MIAILVSITLPIVFIFLGSNLDKQIALDESRSEQDFVHLQFTVGDRFILSPPQFSQSKSEILLMMPQDTNILLRFPSLSQTELASIDRLQNGEKIEVKVLKEEFELASHLSFGRKFINYFINQADKMVLVYHCKLGEKSLFERKNSYPNAVNRYSHIDLMRVLKLSFIPLLLIAVIIGKFRRSKNKQHPLQGK